MSDPWLGEIRIFTADWAPEYWAICDGRLLPVEGNEALYMLLGTSYGGDGVTNFGLPDLRGRVPVGNGPGYDYGQEGGAEFVTLASDQYPAHDHTFAGTTALAGQPSPYGNVPAQSGEVQWWTEDTPSRALAPEAVVPFPGGSQPHANMVPYQTVNYIISLTGVIPSRP